MCVHADWRLQPRHHPFSVLIRFRQTEDRVADSDTDLFNFRIVMGDNRLTVQMPEQRVRVLIVASVILPSPCGLFNEITATATVSNIIKPTSNCQKHSKI